MPPVPNTHRELTVGLLAFQAGMIDQRRLIEAFRVWSRGEGRPLVDILIEQGLPPEQRELLDKLAADHLAAHGGDLQRGLSKLNADASTLEHLSKLDHAGLDQSLFYVLRAGPEEETRTIDEERAATSRSETDQDDGTRYRVIRPHRKGGLGAVYIAVDSELHREVALKQILDEHADDERTRQRFLIEAEITAGLEHPGIVPVYGLGTYRDGRPYYAMRFIRGDNLKEAILEYHYRKKAGAPETSPALELNKLLRRFLDVCNAIAYAHKRGVLHRDIKPGNILIGKYGETLVVDWGLAKASGHSEIEPDQMHEAMLRPSSGSGSGETLPHSRLGTPAYMSPEQARGDMEHVGIASDVYGLGASLYYLLAGRPPFVGRDLVVTLDAVSRGDFPGPRSVDPSIDPALEAICLKAMALRPEDRYTGPRELADDLERWLADEPVGVYRDPVPKRVVRWSRRHATLVASAGVLLVTGLLALGTIVGLIARQNARLRAANDEITRQRNRAEASGLLSRRSVNEMLHEVAHNDLLNIPQGELVRLRLARRASALIRELEGLSPTDPAILLDEARILDEVAALYRLVGKYDEAAGEFATGIALLETLKARDPAKSETIDALAHIESQLGELIRLRGGAVSEAEPHFRRAVGLAKELRRIDPNRPRFANVFATTHNDLANLLAIASRHEEAEPFAREAVDSARVFRSSLPEPPDPQAFQMGYVILPMCRATYGEICMKLGRGGWADHLQLALDEARTLATTYPTSPDAPLILVESSRLIVEGRSRDAAPPEAVLRTMDGHVTMIADLAKNFPSIRHYPRYLVRLRTDRGALRLRAGLLDQADEDLSFAHEQLAARVGAEKNANPARLDLARVKVQLARLAAKREQPKAARERVAEAIAVLNQALAIEPAHRGLTRELADAETFARSLGPP